MNEDKKIATRESFGKYIVELGRLNNNIVVLDSDLSSATKTNSFAKEFPDRFFDMGIAEADMMGTAAGLAVSGKIPFAASFAVFSTGRCYDQIRTSICYPNANVKIIGTHSGITVGEDGATHQMLEDINLMRALPNMHIFSPSDDILTKIVIDQALKINGPVYIRLARQATPCIYDEVTNKNCKSIMHGNGEDITIFATGTEVYQALKAKEIIEQYDNNGRKLTCRVIDMLSIKPIDEDIIIECAKSTKCLVSVEDHNTIGGLGTAIADVLVEKYPTKLNKIGIKDTFTQSGKANELVKAYGLDFESIANKCINFFLDN